MRAFVRICSENHPGPSARFTAKQDFCRRRDDHTTKSISFLGRMLSSPRPNLDHSIQILVDSRLVSSLSHPQKVSEVYLALLGLLYHVKSDNDQLRNARYVKETEIG